jgi:hypothetical protein
MEQTPFEKDEGGRMKDKKKRNRNTGEGEQPLSGGW